MYIQYQLGNFSSKPVKKTVNNSERPNPAMIHNKMALIASMYYAFYLEHIKPLQQNSM